MTPIEVLKMLKFKIETAEQNNHNYVIETSDREVIEQTVLSYGTKSCSTCKHYGVNKYVDPCFSCDDKSNYEGE